MTNPFALFVMSYLICCLFLWWAVRGKRRRLKILAIVMALMVARSGNKLFHIGPLVSNLGNFPFALIVACHVVIYFREGYAGVMDSIRLVFTALTLRLLYGFTVVSWPLVPGNEIAGGVVNTMFQQGVLLTVASYSAMALSQSILVLVLDKTKGLALPGMIILACAISQLIDSVLFFSVAFGFTLDVEEWALVMCTGWIVKMSLGIGFLPLMYYGATKVTE